MKVHNEQAELQADVATLNFLQSQFRAWTTEVMGILKEASNDLKSRIAAEGGRGSILLRRLSLADFYSSSIFDNKQMQSAWDKTKPTFAPHTTTVRSELLDLVHKTADTVAIRGRAQGQSVIEFLGQRPAMKHQSTSLVGSVTAASRFEDTRQHLAQQLQQAIERHVDLDERATEEHLLTGFQRVAWLSAGLNVGAFGSALMSTLQIADFVAGMAGASAMAATSALVMTVGRQQIAKYYSDQWTRRGVSLDEDIQAVCEKEAERLSRRIRDGVAPYTRFVEAEQERLAALSEHCENLLAQAQHLRKRIRNL